VARFLSPDFVEVLFSSYQMNIGFVCTNFNNSAFTETAVRTLLQGSVHEFSIVIVDNCSEDDEIKKVVELAKEFSQVELIVSSVNVGYFAGLNLGIKYLRDIRPDITWMIVGNNDLEFSGDFGDILSARAGELNQFAVIAPDIVTDDGEHQNPHVIVGIGRVREMFYDLYYVNFYLGQFIFWLASRLRPVVDRVDEQQWQTAQSICQGHGSCYVLGPRFFEQFAELWAPTFMMSEEYFLSKQLSDVGQQVFYDPSLKVRHHCHAALAKIPSRSRWEMARDAHRVYRQYVKGFW
jgi:GT2 family glycosyltransferase